MVVGLAALPSVFILNADEGFTAPVRTALTGAAEKGRQRNTEEGPVMTPKLLLAAVAALAIAAGFALPASHKDAAAAREQIPTLVIGRG